MRHVSLQTRIAIYIPSKYKIIGNIWSRETASLFGGATLVPAIGLWSQTDRSVVHAEDIMVMYWCTTAALYEQAHTHLLAMIQALHNMGEEAVAYEINGTFALAWSE